MTTREQALAEILGSVRLEDAEPGPELRGALDRWARAELSDDELGKIAEHAAAGQPLKPSAPPRAA